MIRVLRILEYTYATPEIAEHDMARWYTPARGTYRPNEHMTLKSTVIINLDHKLNDGAEESEFSDNK